jgi:hypothetical protein
MNTFYHYLLLVGLLSAPLYGDTVAIYKCTESRVVFTFGQTDGGAASFTPRRFVSRNQKYVIRSIENTDSPSLDAVVIRYGVVNGAKLYEVFELQFNGARSFWAPHGRSFQGIHQAMFVEQPENDASTSTYVNTHYLRSPLTQLRLPAVGIDFKFVPRTLSSKYSESLERAFVFTGPDTTEAGQEYRYGEVSEKWTLSTSLTAKANNLALEPINGHSPQSIDFAVEILTQHLDSLKYTRQ